VGLSLIFSLLLEHVTWTIRVKTRNSLPLFLFYGLSDKSLHLHFFELTKKQKIVVEWLALLLNIREVPETCYAHRFFRCFPQSLQASAWKYLQVGHDYIIHVYGARLFLWSAASKGFVTIHPPDDMENHDRMILRGENQRTRRKTCPSATMPTTNPTWTDPGLRGQRSVTNCLRRGTTI
jgi:hypothetical protein